MLRVEGRGLPHHGQPTLANQKRSGISANLYKTLWLSTTHMCDVGMYVCACVYERESDLCVV